MYPYTLFLGISLYEIMLMVAVVTSFVLCDVMIVKRGFSLKLQRIVIISLFVSVVFGFFFATLFQAFYNFLADGTFKLAFAGMTFYGGLLGGAGAFVSLWFILGKLFLKDDLKGEHISKFSDMLDISACCIPLAHAIGRIGCFFAGCCHGATSSAWCAVKMHTEFGYIKVIPVQLFESLFLFAVSAILIIAFYKRLNFPLLPLYCGVYAIWRFCIEFARGDNRGASIIPALSPSQLTAILLFVFAVTYLTIFIIKQRKKAPPQ